jgi:hypothetical protein
MSHIGVALATSELLQIADARPQLPTRDGICTELSSCGTHGDAYPKQ